MKKHLIAILLLLFPVVASASSFSSVAGCVRVYADVASHATIADTNETTLGTYTMPANTVGVGNTIEVLAIGAYAANANTKNLRFYFGSQTLLFDSNTLNNIGWVVEGTIVVTGASAQTYGIASWANVAPRNFVVPTPSNSVAAGTQNTTSAITIKVTGQNGTAAANDITESAFIIQVCR